MMDARTQAEAGKRLEAALEAAGIVIYRGSFRAGNLRQWETVDGASILGRLQAMSGWKIDVVEGVVGDGPDPAQLELVP